MTTSHDPLSSAAGEFDDAWIENAHVIVEAATRPTGDVDIRIDGVSEDDRDAVRRVVQESIDQALTGRRAGRRARARTDANRGLIHVGVSPLTTDWALRAEIASRVEDALSDTALALSPCTCAGSYPGDRINARMSEIIWRNAAGDWLVPPPTVSMPQPGPDDPWVIAVALDLAPWNYARLLVFDGARRNPPILRTQTLIGLDNVTDWPKEIYSYNLCSGRVAAVNQNGPSRDVHRMLVDRAVCASGADTIVFRKPGFFGVWHDVGHFPSDFFWAAFGGTAADFTWVFD